MKKNSLLKKLAKISILSGAVLLACDKTELRIDEAYADLERAHFDAALYSFHRLYKDKPQNPRVLAGLGLLLSLKRISLFAAVDLLRASLKIKPNAEVRRQLAMIYIAMGQTKRIAELTRSDNLSVEEAFTPSLIQLHTAASCLDKASSAKLKKLETSPQQEDSSFYYFLCELALKKKEKESIDLLKSYYAIQNPKMRCEALSLCFILENSLPLDFLHKEKKICLQDSRSLLIFQREDLKLTQAELELQKRHTRLFDTDPFSPPDPGPEGLKAPWQVIVQEQKEGQEKQEAAESVPLEQAPEL